MRIGGTVFAVVVALLAAPAWAQGSAMPAWTPHEVPAAAAALRSIAPAQLPRASDPDGFVARISDPATMNYCRDRRRNVQMRLQTCLTAFQATLEVGNLYAGLLESDPTRGDDVMRVVEGLLRGADVLLEVSNEFIPTLDQNAPDYAQRLAGLQQARNGIVVMLRGAIMMLNERDAFPESARLRFAGVLAEIFDRVTTEAPAEQRAELQGALRDVALTDPSADIRAALAQFAG